jgi:hypothetical protein
MGTILAISIPFVDPEEVRPFGATEAAPIEATMCDDDKHGLLVLKLEGKKRAGAFAPAFALGDLVSRLLFRFRTRYDNVRLSARFVVDCERKA